MIAALLVIAQENAHDRPPLLVWPTLRLAGIILWVILVGAAIIWLLRWGRWGKRSGEAPYTAENELAHLQRLYEEGELSQEEFGRIRERLTRLSQPVPQPGDPHKPEGQGGTLGTAGGEENANPAS
jgi:hypothetical protein